ncbi:hypothetical protein Tco_1407168 [Tanacetum coccineum]
MVETMEQYMSNTRTDYELRVARPKIDNKDQFELKGQFLKELRENTFSGSDNEDANEHIEKVLEIVDLFYVPNITMDQIMLRVFPISLTRAASRWLRNEPTGSIKTWEDLKTKFLNKSSPTCTRTAKNNGGNSTTFSKSQMKPFYNHGERFKELLYSVPQYYMTEDSGGEDYRATAPDAAIRNQGASIKTLEIQIRQMSKIGPRISKRLDPRKTILSTARAKIDVYKERLL